MIRRIKKIGIHRNTRNKKKSIYINRDNIYEGTDR